MTNEYLEALADWPSNDLVSGYQRSPRYGMFGVRDELSRHDMVDRYGWAIPTDEAVAAIAAHGPIVEIGAGRGFWAYLLRKAGADVVADDIRPRGGSHWHPEHREPWTPVAYGGVRKAADHPDRTLFLCWPPYNRPMARGALRRYRGDTVAYVGEGPGGCTGDDAFHDALEADWSEVERVDLPQWLGIHDDLTIYRRG